MSKIPMSTQREWSDSLQVNWITDYHLLNSTRIYVLFTFLCEDSSFYSTVSNTYIVRLEWKSNDHRIYLDIENSPYENLQKSAIVYAGKDEIYFRTRDVLFCLQVGKGKYVTIEILPSFILDRDGKSIWFHPYTSVGTTTGRHIEDMKNLYRYAEGEEFVPKAPRLKRKRAVKSDVLQEVEIIWEERSFWSLVGSWWGKFEGPQNNEDVLSGDGSDENDGNGSSGTERYYYYDNGRVMDPFATEL